MFAWIEVTGLSCLWLVGIFRARQAVRHPQQRALWLAVVLIAFTTTLDFQPVTAALAGLVGDVTAVQLFRNVCDVIASTAMLHFVLDCVGYRRHRLPLFSIATVTAVTLVVVNIVLAPPGSFATPELDLPTYYWLIFFGYHLIADIAVVVTCLRNWRSADQWPLQWALLVFGVGTAMACLLWILFLAFVVFRVEALLDYTLLVTGIEEILQAAGAALPMVPGVRKSFSDRYVLLRLWPLWHRMTSTAKLTTLMTSRSRWLDVVMTSHRVELRLYRLVIEIRDATLILSDYLPGQVFDDVRASVTRDRPDDLEATIAACLITTGTQRKASGEAPVRSPRKILDAGDTDLRGEVSFLVRVAAAMRTPYVRDHPMAELGTKIG